MPDETRRRQVLEAIASGRLPAHLPTTSWAGYGSGAVCSVCRRPIGAEQLEAEFGGERAIPPYHLHLQCLAVWEALKANGAPTADPALQVVGDGGYSPAGELDAETGTKR
jgi:hypothetical protein